MSGFDMIEDYYSGLRVCGPTGDFIIGGIKWDDDYRNATHVLDDTLCWISIHLIQIYLCD